MQLRQMIEIKEKIGEMLLTVDCCPNNSLLESLFHGIGLDANIGKKFQEFGKRGPLPYFLIGIKEYLKYKPKKYLVKYNNEMIEVQPLLITIANTKQYGNGAIIAPQADPQDGTLDICILYKIPLLKAIFYTFKLFGGTINTIPNYQSFKAKSLQISLHEKNGIIHTDGEPLMINDLLNIEILKDSLRVCKPV